MNIETLSNDICELLRSNLSDFFEKEDTSTLTATLASKMIRQVQSIVQMIGCRTLEQFFESYDTEEGIITHDGERFHKKYKSNRNFLTILGQINLRRNVYQRSRGGKSIIPLDRMWKMEHEYFSAEMKELVLYSCAHNTPEETSKIIEKLRWSQVRPSTIKSVLDNTGQIIEMYEEQIMESIRKEEKLPVGCDVVAFSLDGVNVLLNEKGKRKGRPKEKPHLPQKEESGAVYKNAMCGSISFYNVEYQSDTMENKPIRIHSNYISRMPENQYKTFKAEFEKEVKHTLQFEPKEKILLVDAHPSIQGYIKKHPLFKDFHFLIDFYHACEHLSNLSEWIFGKNNEEGQKWYEDKRRILKSSPNGVDQLIRSAKYYIKNKLTTQGDIHGAKSELNYFVNHRKMMNYYDFIQKGWPIGSGVIEAACKAIVKQRLGRSGQRWSIKGGQNILTLRTLVKSNRWPLFIQALNQFSSLKCA